MVCRESAFHLPPPQFCRGIRPSASLPADWRTPGQLQRWVCCADRLSDAATEDQPSGFFNQFCCGGGRRRDSFQRNRVSLPQASEFQCHYLEQSRAHVRSDLISAWFWTAILLGVPPEYGGWQSL